VQQAHGVLDSIRKYTTIVQAALGDVAESLPSSLEKAAAGGAGFIVAFGSEHGFVGAFNERLFDVIANEKEPSDTLFVVGARAMLTARERYASVSWNCSLASQVGGIDEVALRVAEGLAKAGGTHAAGRMILVYTSNAGDSSQIITETLLPFDIRPFEPRSERPRALSNLPRELLLDGLVMELLFAKLAHAAAESFASENAARLSAMESASDNIADKLDDLRRTESEVRQEDTTTELMEIVTGVEAIAKRVRRGDAG
jgi:F-type H+-transporting ATPase subunit gamma